MIELLKQQTKLLEADHKKTVIAERAMQRDQARAARKEKAA